MKKKRDPAEDHLRGLTDDELIDLANQIRTEQEDQAMLFTPILAKLDRQSVLALLRRTGLNVETFREMPLYVLHHQDFAWMDQITDEDL